MRKTRSRVPKSYLTLAIVLTLALGGFAAASAPAFTVPTGQRQLFLDDGGIAKMENLKRTFIATVKHGGPYGRTVWLSTSKDFEEWTKPELIFHPDQRDQELARENINARLANSTLQPMFDVDPDTFNVQVYNMGVFRYEGLYVGMPAMFHSTGPRPNYPNTDGFHLIQLVSSRDLRTWKRLGERQPFIGPSPVGAGAYDLTRVGALRVSAKTI